jgi:hypothetical protein
MPRNKPMEEEDDDKLGAFLDSLPDDDGDPEIDEDEDDGEDDDGMSAAQAPMPPPMARPMPPPPPSVVAAAEKPRRGRPPKKNETVAPVLPAPPAGRGIRGPRDMGLSREEIAAAPGFRSLQAASDTAYQEIDTLLASLNFASREYEVRVERIEPNKTRSGVDCSGYLATHHDRIKVEDIERSYGGGLFVLKVFGPHPITGRQGIIKQERIRIAGEAKMPSDHDNVIREAQRVAQGKQDEVAGMMQSVIESQERASQRLLQVVERNKSDSSNALTQLLPAILPLVENLLSKTSESTKTLIESQRVEREERRHEEERRREEQRREEDRRREEEREDRRREEERRRAERDEERRRYEEAKDREREDRESRRRDEEIKREEMREQLRRDEAERQRRHEAEVAALRERNNSEKEQLQLMMKLTQDAAANNQSMLMQSMQFQIDTFAKRAETGGIDSLAKQLLTLNSLRSTLAGDDAPESTLDRVMEVGEKLATTMLPIAQQAMAARAQSRSAAQQQQQQQAPVMQVPPPMPLPKPVVLDLGPKMAALPAPSEVIVNPAPPAQGAADSGLENDLKQLTLPTGDEDLVSAAVLLVKNIDLFVQQNMSPEQIVDQILIPFEEKAPAMMSMAAGLGDGDQLFAFIQTNVPSDWVILSPRGEEIVSKAFELWTNGDDAEEDEVA